MIMGPFFEFPIPRCEDRHGLALLLWESFALGCTWT